MGLIHDLCYHHENRDVWNYVNRARAILKVDRNDRASLRAALADQGVFKGFDGLVGLAESAPFWMDQPYGTRLYYGTGVAEYLHRDVLRAAIRALSKSPCQEKIEEIAHQSINQLAEVQQMYVGLFEPAKELIEYIWPNDRLISRINWIEFEKLASRLHDALAKTKLDVHTAHCCKTHGCKYGENDTCTVATGARPQEFRCGQLMVCGAA